MATCAPDDAASEARGPSRGADLSIPNLITLGRILLVPVVVWAITAGEMRIAFVLFLAAGISDAVDGFLAKRFGMATELGAYLDPLADKAMLVSIYVALGIADAVPGWLVILVVSRDIMIVTAVILSWLVDKPVALKPLLVSKLNTVAQIALACVIMAARGFDFDAGIAVIVLLVPLLMQQGAALITHIPGYFKRIKELIVDSNLPWLNWLDAAEAGKTASDLVGQVATWLLSFSYSLWTGGKALVSFASVLIVMPVVTFYLIRDWHSMIDKVDSWVPLRQRQIVRQLGREIDAAIGGFLRGQLGVCLVLGCYYAFGLMLVGLELGLLIGLIAGVITFVPYIGSMTGLMIATSVAIAQFWPDWKRVTLVVAIFLVGQFIEGNIVSPKFVGERVGLHPVWLIFAMFAFGYLFGFVGLLIAVPLGAAIAVVLRFALRQYFASSLYTGDKPR